MRKCLCVHFHSYSLDGEKSVCTLSSVITRESYIYLQEEKNRYAVSASTSGGWATGWMIEFRFPEGTGISFLADASGSALGLAQPPIPRTPWVISRVVKRPGREAHHSPHLVPRLKMYGATPSILQYVFMEWCLVKHRDNFTTWRRVQFHEEPHILFPVKCLHFL
jgi:hypothetical protein